MNKKVLTAVLLVFMAGGVIAATPVKKQIKLTQNVVVEQQNKQKIKTKKEEVVKLLENLRYTEAQKEVEELLEVDNSDLDANIYYNTCLINTDRLNEAQENIDKLLKNNENNSDLHFLQGLIYLKRPETSDMNYRRNSEYYYDNGIEELNRALELDKNNYKAYNARGIALLAKGNYSDAEQDFKEAIKLNRDYATAYDNLGTLYYQQGNYEVAENRFNEAIARNPYCYTGFYHLARLNYKNGEYTIALEYLEKSILINSSFAHAYNLAGEIYAKQQNDAAAIVNYKKAIELSPEYTIPYLNLAKLYENRSDNEFALESLKTVAGLDKNTDAVCLKIADIELAKGNYSLAEKYYSSIPADSDFSAESVKGLAETYWLQASDLIIKASSASSQKLYQAREKLNSAIALNPSDIELRLAKLKLDKLIGSEFEDSEFKKILDSTPKTAAEYVVKGEAYTVEGDFVKAKQEFTSALESADNITDYKYLAEYFTFCKNYELALSALNKAELINPADIQIVDNRRYINTKINKSDEFYNDAIYFKKEGDKFFTREYLLKAVEENPSNIEANKLLAKYYKKGKNLKAECKCYKQIAAASDEPREISKYSKRIVKLEKKIKRTENKEGLWQRLFG